MFGFGQKNKRDQVKKRISWGLACLLLCSGIPVLSPAGFTHKTALAAENEIKELTPENIIRFHVIANSDSEEDQLLKYAVRDEILKEAAPRLAKSASLAESRQILKGMENELLSIARRVIQEWGKNYAATLDYGIYPFPTKAYGTIVLPGGEYEAVKIKIGKAEGANWWCVLFPPLCFVNAEESTTLPVDGKPGVPLGAAAAQKNGKNQESDKSCDQDQNSRNGSGKEGEPEKSNSEKSNSERKSLLPQNLTYKGKKVGFFFDQFFNIGI